MRGAATFTEGLFTLKKLDDLVPSNRTMTSKELAELGELFAQTYAEDIKGGRTSIAPEKLLRAMCIKASLTCTCPIALPTNAEFKSTGPSWAKQPTPVRANTVYCASRLELNSHHR
jgi:hypothetical protein